jgi:hypothetical protein
MIAWNVLLAVKVAAVCHLDLMLVVKPVILQILITLPALFAKKIHINTYPVTDTVSRVT